MHHDLGALGAAVNKRAMERQLEILKSMGCNAIRTAHNPQLPNFGPV
jgi:beta-galactosidase